MYKRQQIDYTIRDELGISSDEIIVTCIAELNRNKNHDFLIQVWAKIKKRISNIKLILVGDGDLLEEMKEKVKRDGLSGVFFLGKRVDIPQIFK